ncbi:retropepsin-like domain-containing protein [Chryseobacterium sp. RG1]|uniref:Retropepsin-like domain-containing protein n=1 Tax=Chryseobacterium tagetis TaxID=2801334 RepID=A0ABS8A0W0_9FLAO|nr:retropepsin-like aspartic protease [Chryseobacterium tagetis]MCA6067068.1 retropepsin-like domain-containing protein [Chryseobacterium tagetis]
MKINALILLLLLCPFSFKATVIPFELIEGKIILNVKIKNDQHNFLFDTGAFTIISSELKDQINAKKSNIIFEGTDANNAKSKMDVFTISNLKVSDLTIKNVNFSFADISWISSRACKKISGILGANTMKDKVWQINFKNKTLTVSDKTDNNLSSGSVIIPFTEGDFTSVPKIEVNIRGQMLNYVFDTGSGMGFSMNQQSYNKLKGRDFLTFEGLLAQSLNSISKGERQIDMMEVQFGDVNVGNQIIDSSLEGINLLGTKFMENYLVVIDFINKKIILNPNGNKPEYNSFGVSFVVSNDSLIIVNKLLIPQLSELKLSEKIIKINTLDVSKANDDVLCEVKKLLDEVKIITIENESHQKFTLEKKDILKLLN